MTVRAVRALTQTALTAGAVVGGACLLLALAAALFGVRPIIFRSGSMSPTITTGSLGISHRTPAAELRVGDVVTVPYNGTRITHRIVQVTHGRSAATLRLKGDGNSRPDATAYQVTSAPRLWFAVPWVGGAVAWLSRPPGIYVLGLYLALMLSCAVRPGPEGSGGRRVRRGPPSRRRGRRRWRLGSTKRAGATAVAAMVGLAGPAGPASAAPWTDSVNVSGTALTAFVVPKPAITACSVTGNSLIGFTATTTWSTGYLPPGTTTPMNYTAILRELALALTVNGTGATRSTAVTTGLLSSLFGATVHVDIVAKLPGTPAWASATSTQPLDVGVLGLSLTCGAAT